MSLFLGGDKFGSVYLNGDSWAKAYLNGDLIFQKGSPAPTGNFMSIWWNDPNTSVITEEVITSVHDIAQLCSTTAQNYTITLSNGHSFSNTDIVDVHFNNATTFPTSIPTGFGRLWTSLNIGSQSGNTTLAFPDACTIIGDNLFKDSAFNATDVDFNNVLTIGAGFLEGTPYNGTLTGLTGVNTIGDRFLYNCMSFNKPVSCNPTTIGGYFLAHNNTRATNAMTSAISLGSRLTSIGTDFLAGLPSRHNVFNNTINFPATLVTIGNRFMAACNYAGTIDLSATAITTIGTDFQINGACSGFAFPTGQSVSVGNGFMHAHQTLINGTLVIPANVAYIGSDFLYNTANRYVYQSIEVNADPSAWASDSTYLTHSYSKHGAADLQYITVTGTYAAAYKTKYPASDTSLTYQQCRYYA